MIKIKLVTTTAECRHIEHIMTQAWGNAWVVPNHLLITLAANSSCMLLAWDGDLPVGFCYGFAAFSTERTDDPAMEIRHHSH